MLLSGCGTPTVVQKDIKNTVLHEEPVLAPDSSFNK